MKTALRRLSMVLAWAAGCVVGLGFLFFVYPNLAESTKWTLGGVIVALVAAYHFNSVEEKATEWRSDVDRELADFRHQLDRIERKLDRLFG